MSDKPMVTIVVPAFNAAGTIRETLESLAAQTYGPLEIIIIDDGSKDETGKIARDFAESHSQLMKYVYQQNAGQARALNNGWSMARGELIGYLSADDVLYPDAIAELVGFLETRGLACAYPDYDLIDADSAKIRLINAPDFDARDLIEKSICQPGPGALFRKSVFLKTGGWKPELRLTPDFDFWVRFTRYGEIARLPKALAGFRVHEGSQSFAPPSPQKAEEPPNVIASYFADGGGGDPAFRVPVALAWAHVLSSRLHFRAGRLVPAFGHLAKALRFHIAIVAQKRFWHLLASGILGRLRYQLQYRTK